MSCQETSLSIKFLIVDENDNLKYISPAKLKRISEGNDKKVVFKNEKVRLVEAIIERLGGEVINIIRLNYSQLVFTNEGRIDWDKELSLTIDLLEETDENENHPAGNIINARNYFLQKQYEREFKWQPSVELENKIKLKLLFNR
jgi:hypothetical protein